MNKTTLVHKYNSQLPSFKKYVHNLSVIGSNQSNSYFPIYCCYTGDEYNPTKEINENIFLYTKPIIDIYNYTRRVSYTDFFAGLNGDVRYNFFKIKLDDAEYTLKSDIGYITDSDDKLLMVLCTNSKEIVTDNQLNVEKLRLYVSTELLLNPIYKNIYKKIEKEYIQHCYTNSIEVLFCDSNKIHKKIYNNDFEMRFDTVEDMVTELNDEKLNTVYF